MGPPAKQKSSQWTAVFSLGCLVVFGSFVLSFHQVRHQLITVSYPAMQRGGRTKHVGGAVSQFSKSQFSLLKSQILKPKVTRQQFFSILGSLGKKIVHSVCSKLVCNYSPRVVTGWIPWWGRHTTHSWRSQQPRFALIERSKVAELTFFHFKTLDTDQTDFSLVTAHNYDANTGKSCVFFFSSRDRILNINMSVPDWTAFITFSSIKKQKLSAFISRVCLSKRDISARGCRGN